jgi:hypothetical protein
VDVESQKLPGLAWQQASDGEAEQPLLLFGGHSFSGFQEQEPADLRA